MNKKNIYMHINSSKDIDSAKMIFVTDALSSKINIYYLKMKWNISQMN